MVYVVELVQAILFSQKAFEEFAAGFRSFKALHEVGNFWFAIPILSSTGMPFGRSFSFFTSELVAFAVQISYAHKIKFFAKSNFIAAVVVLVKISFFVASEIVLFLYVVVRLDPTRRRNWRWCT